MRNPKVAIVGSRNLSNTLIKSQIIEILKSLNPEELVSGGAKSGADQIAEEISEELQIPIQIFYPDWDKYGRSAGIIRNKEIIQHSDAIIAVWDRESRGTRSSIQFANKLGKNVTLILNDERSLETLVVLSNFELKSIKPTKAALKHSKPIEPNEIQSWVFGGRSADDITKSLVGLVQPTLSDRFPNIKHDHVLNGIAQLHRTVHLWLKGHRIDIVDLKERIQAYHILLVVEGDNLRQPADGHKRPNGYKTTDIMLKADRLGLYGNREKPFWECSEQEHSEAHQKLVELLEWSQVVFERTLDFEVAERATYKPRKG